MSIKPEGKQKYAWHDVVKVGPPKRPAAERIQDFKEIYCLYDEARLREQASRCIECPEALCVQGCPLNNRIPEWMALAAEGNYIEAAALSRSTSNMPEICSRVCPQERLCEGSCILNGKGAEPPPIGAVEKFINEYAFAHGAIHFTRAMPNGLSVAVIGAGPAGMSCADELARRGYAVTIFESMPVPGGLLTNGIPGFKLEKHIIDRRFEFLRQRGVELRLNATLGKDVTLEELLEKFDAVFLGIGAQKAKPVDVPGGDLKGVYQALPFLIQKNVDYPFDFPPIDVSGKRVAVLGGGDTAMDCLRTALRCNAKEAVCVYRRDLANMPGSRKEYVSATEEGAQFLFLTNPIAITGNGAGEVTRLECVKMELGAPDASGRRKPRPVPDSKFALPVEVIIAAYGFDPVPFPSDSDLSMIEVNEWGGVVVDANQMTSVEGVFAGGDLSRGPSLVVHAVRDARKAATAIHKWLAEKRTGGIGGAPVRTETVLP